jgi:hypothetical protein
MTADQFDDWLRREVRAVEPREQLANEIVASVSAPRTRRGYGQILRWVVGIAALIALTFLGVFTVPAYRTMRTVQGIESFPAAMSYFIDAGRFTLDERSADIDELTAWVAENSGPVPELGNELRARAPIGCKLLNWRGETVTLLCFRAESGRIVHLFTVPRSRLGTGQWDSASRVESHHGRETVEWVHGDNAYVLVPSHAGMSVQQYVPDHVRQRQSTRAET